ncbi:hypothetical protein QQF64_026415 [Cirrhinus molitorella]|uniref:Uncharacterized protein n=1 Tax=Cirrhinus molitorella TaxID=172907 RepID=A0ABR3N9V3_9TELE
MDEIQNASAVLQRRGVFITASELRASLVGDTNRTRRILGLENPKRSISSSQNHHTAPTHHTHVGQSPPSLKLGDSEAPDASILRLTI